MFIYPGKQHLPLNRLISRLHTPLIVKLSHIGIHVMLAGMLVIVCASLVTTLLPRHLHDGTRHNPIPPVPVHGAMPIKTLVDAHLFGQALPAATPDSIPPPTNIVLTGILFATNAADSRALLSVNGHTVIAAIGDSVSEGIQIISIETDRVHLMQSGAKATLKLRFTGDPSGNPGWKNLISDAGHNGPNYTNTIATATNTMLPITPALQPLYFPSSAPPTQQMQNLRSQLIAGKSPRFIPHSPISGHQ